jgi:ribose 5-phosphate isomerase A
MNQNIAKKNAAYAALKYMNPKEIIGVGTGSTVNFFIEALGTLKEDLAGAVASSLETEKRLKALKIPVFDLNAAGNIALYVDGADEINDSLQMIKGGGGALTREKIIAAAARKFVCIADPSKKVKILGKFPLPIEVIPMARSYVARKMVSIGGTPIWRENFITDNGNVILDVHNLEILDPVGLEKNINNIAGVVTNGIFALRPADVFLFE